MNAKLINVGLCKLKNAKGMTKQSTLNECYFYVKNARNNIIIRDNNSTGSARLIRTIGNRTGSAMCIGRYGQTNTTRINLI